MNGVLRACFDVRRARETTKKVLTECKSVNEKAGEGNFRILPQKTCLSYFAVATIGQAASAVSSGEKSSMSLSLEQHIQETISTNKVLVYSKTYCGFCRRVKGLFCEMGVEATIFELDKIENGAAVQEGLLSLTGQRTVPNVFVNGKHLGGSSDTQEAARSGRLQELLADGG